MSFFPCKGKSGRRAPKPPAKVPMELSAEAWEWLLFVRAEWSRGKPVPYSLAQTLDRIVSMCGEAISENVEYLPTEGGS